jgi:hypothetical protein
MSDLPNNDRGIDCIACSVHYRIADGLELSLVNISAISNVPARIGVENPLIPKLSHITIEMETRSPAVLGQRKGSPKICSRLKGQQIDPS